MFTFPVSHFSSTGYQANAVTFDGSSDFLDQNATVGYTDSKLWTFTCWFRRNNSGVEQEFFDMRSTTTSTIFRCSFQADNKLFFFISDTIGDVLVATTTGTFTDTDWHSLLFSVDMSDTGKRHLIIDDSAEAITFSTYNDRSVDGTDFDDPAIGAFPSGILKFNGDLADFYHTSGQHIDFSVEANRRKFIDAAGKPVNLGADGGTPTGTPPITYLSGITSTWHTNDGSGTGYTERGALTDAATSPSD